MIPTFYVHIVESLAPEELLCNFAPGRALAEFLSLSGIPYQYNNVVDKIRFQQALSSRVVEGMRTNKTVPIMHLAMHGAETGVQLTEQRNTLNQVAWQELASYLLPIHQSLTYGLPVCMSSCKGIHGLNMANTMDPKTIPYSWLVGFGSDVQWRDLALAYAVFYRRFQNGLSGNQLIEAVKSASGHTDFSVADGKIAQTSYSSSIINTNVKSLEQLLGVSKS